MVYACRSFDVVSSDTAGDTNYDTLLSGLPSNCDYSLGVADPAP